MKKLSSRTETKRQELQLNIQLNCQHTSVGTFSLLYFLTSRLTNLQLTKAIDESILLKLQRFSLFSLSINYNKNLRTISIEGGLISDEYVLMLSLSSHFRGKQYP